MAQGDFGVVPNVWRPQFVPPINTGEDTQAGIPGNSADNLGATSTTIQESFFNVPVVGWQKAQSVGPFIFGATTYTTIFSFTYDTRTSDHLFVIAYKDPPAGFGGANFRFTDGNAAIGTLGPTSAVANGVGVYVVRLGSMLNLSLPTLSPAFHRSFALIGNYLHSMTASTVATGTSGTVVSGGNGATDVPFEFIDTTHFMNLQVQMVGAGTTITITKATYYKLGNQLSAITT